MYRKQTKCDNLGVSFNWYHLKLSLLLTSGKEIAKFHQKIYQCLLTYPSCSFSRTAKEHFWTLTLADLGLFLLCRCKLARWEMTEMRDEAEAIADWLLRMVVNGRYKSVVGVLPPHHQITQFQHRTTFSFCSIMSASLRPQTTTTKSSVHGDSPGKTCWVQFTTLPPGIFLTYSWAYLLHLLHCDRFFTTSTTELNSDSILWKYYIWSLSYFDP